MNKLRILLRNYSDFEHALTEQARLFEAAHSGVEVELIAVGIHELYDAALTHGGLRTGEYDLALLVTDWLSEALATGSTEDLLPWHRRLPLPDWPHGWAASLQRPLTIAGQLTALPWHDGPECLVYRADLFSNPASREAFRQRHNRELEPPVTWDDFERIAAFFTNPAENLYGTVFAAFPDGHNTLYDFALQLWSRGGELLDSEGRPHLLTPPAIAALDFYRRVVRDPLLCHPQSPHLDSTQSGDIFLEGEVAMMANWFGFAARSGRPGSPLSGKVAIAPVPAAPGHPPVSLSVFWACAIGSGSRNKTLAWEFLRFIAHPERDLALTRHGTVGVRLSTWRNADLQQQIPAYREIEGISLGARQLPTGPAMAAFASIIDSVITRALSTHQPTSDILESAQQQIDSQGLKFS